MITSSEPSREGFTARQRDGGMQNPLDRECADLIATMAGAAIPPKRANAADRS
jgi:hypothetical protein